MQLRSLRDHPTFHRGHAGRLRKQLLLGRGGKITATPLVSSGFVQQGVYLTPYWCHVPLASSLVALQIVPISTMQIQSHHQVYRASMTVAASVVSVPKVADGYCVHGSQPLRYNAFCTGAQGCRPFSLPLVWSGAVPYSLELCRFTRTCEKCLA